MTAVRLMEPLDVLLEGDCRKVLREMPANYFSTCITDPPYNYEFIGREWNEDEVNRRLDRVKKSNTLVKNIPYGSGLAGGVRNSNWYARSRKNILDYQEWCAQWSAEEFRVVRPGAYVLVFNSTRTIAHVQVALELAGFYSRDILVYRRHAGIPKGLNAARKLASIGDEKSEKWEGWHSCLRNEWEAICVVQKPLLGDYITTIKKYGVGLLNAEMNGDGFMSNIIEDIARHKADKVEGHCTVKPLELMRLLVKLVVPESGGHIVLDPFAGTGTTCLAAAELGHHYVGVELNNEHILRAQERLRLSVSKAKPKSSSLPQNMELFA